jgi:hypothetical protein
VGVIDCSIFIGSWRSLAGNCCDPDPQDGMPRSRRFRLPPAPLRTAALAAVRRPPHDTGPLDTWKMADQAVRLVAG